MLYPITPFVSLLLLLPLHFLSLNVFYSLKLIVRFRSLQIFEFRYPTGMAEVGCMGEVIKHERLVDDQFFLICKGQERFHVINLVRTKPYLIARVTWLEDQPSGGSDDNLEGLANEVETYMKDVICLSNQLNGKPEKEAQDLRTNMFPTPFSFFVGSTFVGAPKEQQALLALEDTTTRLKRERETLRNKAEGTERKKELGISKANQEMKHQ
uniref:Lon N-terminal domain-containing protein n=1 Tax=Nelumbo nucifera TaxID=4432 RepID=A0A822ZAI3_NELNU|nr:TPA_asm: hypothetical protein HUJ06_015873 [Nelumbo nucifera]